MTDKTELKRLADAATQGEWQVIETELPCRLGLSHIERRIFTVKDHPQLEAPYPVVNGSVALGTDETPVHHMVSMTAENAAFIAAANPEAIKALIEELEWSQLMNAEEIDRVEISQGLQLKARNSRDRFKAECDQLKAQVERLKAGVDSDMEEIDRIQSEYDKQFRKVRGLRIERDKLQAENEALRDDIEQNQYDANAWRNGEESVWIEVFNSEGDDPFISAITGQITVEQLTLIQAEILEYREDYFEKGSGLYVFKCRHCQAHHDNVGMTEPAHWETHFESYSPFPREEDAAAMGEGELS